ncbi:ABC transporter substrate-binding protein [Streptomyces sp. NPDC054796]
MAASDPPHPPMSMPMPMPMSRRRLLGAAAGAAAALPLSACGAGAPEDEGGGNGGGGGSGGDTFTTYWNAGHDYKAYQKVIAEFEKDHGVTVRQQLYQWDDLRTRLLTDFNSENVPDLVEEPGGWTQEFALSGDAASLRPYVERDGEKMGYPHDWQPASVRHNSHRGEPYGVQLHLTCSLLLYNKRMLDRAGIEPPTTWDEVVSAAKELTRDNVHGIALNQDQSYAWPWLLQNGVRQYDRATQDFLVPRDAALEALQFQADLVHRHKVSPVPPPGTDYSGPQKLLSADRAAMIVSGPWDLAPIAKSSPDLELGIAQAPRGKKRSTILAGTSVFVPAKAKNPDLSWDFIKRITALDVELAATKEAGMMMPRRSWAKAGQVRDDPTTRAFAEGVGYAEDPYRDVYLTGHYGEITTDLFKRLYQGVVMEGKPVEEAYEEYVAAARKLLKR